jgi:hypothetical protein
MKHINENGQIASDDLKILLSELEDLVVEFTKDLEPLECMVIAKHVAASVSYSASSSAFRNSFKK